MCSQRHTIVESIDKSHCNYAHTRSHVHHCRWLTPFATLAGVVAIAAAAAEVQLIHFIHCLQRNKTQRSLLQYIYNKNETREQEMKVKLCMKLKRPMEESRTLSDSKIN